jgi:hypothetical protein
MECRAATLKAFISNNEPWPEQGEYIYKFGARVLRTMPRV